MNYSKITSEHNFASGSPGRESDAELDSRTGSPASRTTHSARVTQHRTIQEEKMTTALMPMPSHTRLRMTARGRRVIVGMVSLPLAAAVFLGALAGGEALASRSASAPAGEFTTVLVEPGDSLWSIALEVAPASDPRDVVDEIVRLNALGSSTVDAGQRIAIPTEFSS